MIGDASVPTLLLEFMSLLSFRGFEVALTLFFDTHAVSEAPL
jgi:hypothetical protein